MIRGRLESLLGELDGLLDADRLAGVLIRGASGSFVVKVAGAGLGFGAQVALARMLGSEDYGSYTFVWTTALLVATLGTVGFKNVLTRYVPSLEAEGKLPELHGLLRSSTRSVLLVSGGVAVLGGAAAYVYHVRTGSSVARVFIAGAILVPLIAMTYTRQGALRGLKRVVRAQVPFQVMRPVFITVLVAALFFLAGDASALESMGLTAVAFAVIVGVATYWLYSDLPSGVRESDPASRKPGWLKVALPYMLISGAALVQSNVDIVMTGALLDPESSGIYKASVRIAGLLGFALSSANMIVAPLVSEFHTKGEKERLQRVVAWGAFVGFLFTVVGAIVLIAYGRFLVGLFGPEFVEGYPALTVLVLGEVTFTMAGPTGMLMTMTGHEWLASKAFAVGALVNVALNFALLPPLGMIGAAVATSLSTVSWNAILAWAAVRRLDINPTGLFLPLRVLRGEWP